MLMYVHVHVRECLYTCVPGCVWRPEVDTEYLSLFLSTIVWGTGSLTEPGAHPSVIGRSENSGDPPVSTALPAFGVTEVHRYAKFLCGG